MSRTILDRLISNPVGEPRRGFLLDLLGVIRVGALETRLARAHYVRAIQDLVALLPEAEVHGLRACRTQVQAWLVEDALVNVDTDPMTWWAIAYEADLDLVEAELARTFEGGILV